MRILFALPGLHKYNRGAEIAFISVASELARLGATVTLIGSGDTRPDAPYRFIHAASIGREWFEHLPSVPVLTSHYVYEELTFAPDLLRVYRPSDYDLTVTCSFPFTNWILRRPSFAGRRPPHVFVTQNGDSPAQANNYDYRYFGCEGLICINPDYYERNKATWRCQLIPNGVNTDRFTTGPRSPARFGIPADRLVILMVSALIPNKRVSVGVELAAKIPHAHLVVAGDGEMRAEIEERARTFLPDRFTRVQVKPEEMPALYQAADVFLHCSEDEPFGNVFVEAMACGLPVVAHDTPRTRWIVGNDEYLADTRDLAATVTQTNSAASAKPVLREKRVAKAARFSWKNIAREYLDFFEQVVAADKRKGPRA
jgi:glycosyltransferase involved in cell wall biosynthesis